MEIMAMERETALKGDRRRWLALIPLSLGTLIVVLDGTVLNVSLPSIRRDLGFDEHTLTWVVNAYTLASGSLLLLSGRLGDIYGPRRMFLLGVSLFTLASLTCGLAQTQAVLIVGRALQGVGGSVMASVSLALAMGLFSAVGERSRAIALLGFISVAGGTIGVVVGGIVTNALGWHWVFLINAPIGVLVYAACVSLLPVANTARHTQRLDIWGAVTITSSLVTALYAVENAAEVHLLSARTLGLLACSAVLLAAFLIIETRVPSPLMPMHVLKKKSLGVVTTIVVLLSLGSLSLSYMLSLYMGGVLGYSPLRIALVFLPASIVGAVFTLGLSAKLISTFGLRWSAAGGLLLASLGLALFAALTASGATDKEMLLCMILVGIGTSVASNALSVAVMGAVATSDLGLASGIINTLAVMAGMIGLAIFAGLASSRTSHLLASGVASGMAMAGGYRIAFVANAVCAFLAAVIGATFLRAKVDDSNEAAAPAGVETARAVDQQV